MLTGVRTDIEGAKCSFHVLDGRRMKSVDHVDVPYKDMVVCKMGDSHIMLEEMPKTVKKGAHFNLALVFRKSEEKTIPLTLEGAEAGMGKDHAYSTYWPPPGLREQTPPSSPR